MVSSENAEEYNLFKAFLEENKKELAAKEAISENEKKALSELMELQCSIRKCSEIMTKYFGETWTMSKIKYWRYKLWPSELMKGSK